MPHIIYHLFVRERNWSTRNRNNNKKKNRFNLAPGIYGPEPGGFRTKLPAGSGPKQSDEKRRTSMYQYSGQS